MSHTSGLQKYIWRKLSLLNVNWRKNKCVTVQSNSQSLWSVIFHFRSQISKTVADYFEEHKKLGRRQNFQKFLATGGLINPKRRLIGGSASFFYHFQSFARLARATDSNDFSRKSYYSFSCNFDFENNGLGLIRVSSNRNYWHICWQVTKLTSSLQNNPIFFCCLAFVDRVSIKAMY